MSGSAETQTLDAADTSPLDASLAVDTDAASVDASIARSACPVGSGCRLRDGRDGRCCHDACVDPLVDDRNCGGCGIPCPTGMRCMSGACLYPSCAGALDVLAPETSPGRADFSPCLLADGSRGTCCRGACHALNDFDGDAANCGGCGLACPTAQTCVGAAAARTPRASAGPRAARRA